MKPFSLDPRTGSALREYWCFYAARTDAVLRDLRRAVAAMPEVVSERSVLFPEQLAARDGEAYKLQRDAIVDGLWEPLLEYFARRGEQLALSGVSYSAWYDFTMAFRDTIREHARLELQEDVEGNLRRATAVSDGLNALLDLSIRRVTDAYVATKERLVVRAEERYHTIFDRSPLPMWIYDRDTLELVAANTAAASHYGYRVDEMVGMTLANFWVTNDLGVIRAALAETTSIAASTWQHRKRDGSMVRVEVRGADLSIAGRDVRLSVIVDITEREAAARALRETEDQLRHAQKIDALGRFAGDIAHDFANMLTVIDSYAWTLEDSLDVSDSRSADAAAIRKAAERATDLTRQLMSLSRHKLSAPRAIEVDSVIDDFMPMLSRLVGATIAIELHKGGATTVLADPGQLEQVVMNLAVNARDAMVDGGRLTIETSLVDLDTESAEARGVAPGRYVVMALTDTGTGMDAETQRRIFEPFFTTKPAGRGTGLGLSIVHGIVAEAGGVVVAHSKPGHGTTFRVYLPAHDAVVVAPETFASTVTLTLPPLTALVVDDDQDVRCVAARILRDAGCRIVEASTPEEARRTCVTFDGTIDIAIIDAVLGDGPGEALGDQLRELRPSLRVLLVSGYAAMALRVSQPFLAKPFSPRELRLAVARAVANSHGSSAATSVSATARARVLVADDDDAVRRTVARVLRRDGFEVVEADSGRAAEAELAEKAFDVVVSDVHMPDGDGISVLRAVRRVDLDAPVILVSGAPDVDTAARAVEYGAFRYVTKPIDLESMTALVRLATRAHALARLRRDALTIGGVRSGVADRAGLEVRFDRALEGLWMAYQPIVEARTGARFGVEALARSEEPSMSTPGPLFEAATELDRLSQIGRRIRALSASGIAARSDLALFVNLHPDDLLDVDLIDEHAPLTRIASQVVLEITERSALKLTSELSERLDRLRGLGFRIAVDDIGAGYSGLATFTELMPEIVKIDQSLVRDVHLSLRKQRTIAALASLCHEVGCQVVGEGVETEPERSCLRDLGCDLLQGYLIGRPNRDLA